MDRNYPRVRIGIVAFNSLDDLPKCLSGIDVQTYPNLTITILDNASSDNTIEWLSLNRPDIHLIVSEQNMGYGRGHNQILKASDLDSHDYYLSLNPDVTLYPEYISELLSALTQNGGGWATGKLLQANLKSGAVNKIYSVGHAIYRDGFANNIGYDVPDQGQYEIPRQVFGAPGAACLMSNMLIESLIMSGGELFDEEMFLYNEDVDLDWRARRLGWTCWYVPTAIALHRGSNPTSALRAEAIVNRYITGVKNAYLFDLLTFNLPLMVLHCLLRLIATPRAGIIICRQLLHKAPRALTKRTPSKVPRTEILRWFKWSADQSTGAPKTLYQRAVAFHHSLVESD